ncbi:hypothetical protein, partial [uncultured Umboniibacter sp.]|uniref:hypothetical protein n=1 Tax=uncultured Umboniibacter sp. TaxID=1798917 RepID=UPI00260A75A3
SPGGIVIDLASDNANYLEYVQYRWDAFGNLVYRHDQSGSKNLKESFSYDILNRVTNAAVSGDLSHAETFSYDGHG